MRRLALVFALAAAPLQAQTPAAAPSPSAPPPPYSTPWLLRPAAAATVVRLDSTVALYEDAARGTSGDTVVESFTASYKLSPRFAPLFRLTWLRNSAPERTSEASGRAFSHPLLGLTYLRPLKDGFRLALFAGSTIPIGQGGGDSPDAGQAAAVARGVPARSAMDNALFSVNYWTVTGGVGLARVTPGLTLQAEATVLQLTRVRGPESQDHSRTNFTCGLHAGHFFGKRVSLGGELRLQRWLSTPAPVRANARARDTLTASIGPRLHFKAGKRWIRPGLAWTHALDDPLRAQGYDMVQLDVPVSF